MVVFISRYLKRTGFRTSSAMLKTAGLHWRADAVLSFGMFAGFLECVRKFGISPPRISG
jgi:divalent metal cation (Fe/Co/Zn/Cd) transporter